MDNNQSMIKKDREIVDDLERKIKNNKFSTKDELFNEMVRLRNSGVGATLDNRKMRELLDLFDSIKKLEELPLDMSSYKNTEYNDDKLIIRTDSNRVLTTNGSSTINEEFKQQQNEIMANNKGGNTNADEVFERMSKYQKNEMNLISITDAKLLDSISLNLLNKIKFFLSNTNLNPNVIKVDIKTEAIYDIEANEVYEVKEVEGKKEYEIYNNKKKIEKNPTMTYSENSDVEELEYEENKQQTELEQTKFKAKVRTLKKENNFHIGNSAFTKFGLLLTNIITISLLAFMAIMLYK